MLQWGKDMAVHETTCFGKKSQHNRARCIAGLVRPCSAKHRRGFNPC